MKERTKKRILPTLAIAVTLPLIIFLSTTFDVYAGNYNEFVFSIWNFYGICCLFFLLATALIFFILLFLPNKAYRIVASIFIGLAFMMFIQGVALNGSLSTLSGDGEGMIIPTYLIVIDLVIWIAVLALFIVLAAIPDKKGIFSAMGKIVVAVILVTQILTPISSAITKHDMFLSFEARMERSDDDYTHMLLTNKNLTTVADSGNIFVFCVDKFDETWVETIYDNQPELFEPLDGFTWFQDHISRYGHTYPSIINMLTETPYSAEKDTSRVDFLNKAYDNANSLKTLVNEGWKINIFSESYYSFNDAFYIPDYVENKSEAKEYYITNAFKLGLNMVKLGFYRTLPFIIKEHISNLNSNTFASSVEESDGQGHKNYRPANEVVNKWTDTKFTTLEGKGFYFIHTQGLHDAYKAEKRAPSFKLNMKIISRYIDYLKEKGLYEDATIIITGDHGNGTPYNKTELTGAVRTGMFIKPKGVAGGELKTSNAQTSHTQLWTTILEQAGANNSADLGTSILETPENEDIDRPFTWHTYNCKLIEFQYMVHGSAKNFDNWELIEKTSYNRKIVD